MLEFYYKHQRKIFKHKAKKLAYELTCVFETEKINVMESKNINISEEYKPILGNKLFSELNNLYFTIRSSKAKNHFLLNKYLPENKKELQSNFLSRISSVVQVGSAKAWSMQVSNLLL